MISDKKTDLKLYDNQEFEISNKVSWLGLVCDGLKIEQIIKVAMRYGSICACLSNTIVSAIVLSSKILVFSEFSWS